MKVLKLALAAIVAASTMFATAATADAADIDDGNGHWPVIQYNHRGDDVKALQYLLKGSGHLSGSVDGVFGSGTRTAVKNWQAAVGHTQDGYMVDADWSRIVPTLGIDRPVAPRDHVRALQHALNVKDGALLVVDGYFGSNTHNAVEDFQEHANTYLSSSAALTVDGIAGESTWRQLLFHYVHMDPSADLCNPGSIEAHEWAHTTSVAAIERAGYYFENRNWSGIPGQSLLAFWDSAEEHGGDISGHGSHEVGMDVDTGMVFDAARQCTYRSSSYTYNHSKYDAAGTIALVGDILHGADFGSNGMIKRIYYNDSYVENFYPALIAASNSTHAYHLHVRYCTRPNEGHTSAYEASYTGGTCS